VHQAQLGARQQQSVASEQGLKEAVVAPLAIGCVANYRVRDVLEVSAQLMAASAQWFEFD